jgi:Reverse transcriptase (RNA-dependent DNA polymerase)
LKKSIYGLVQAARAWWKRFATVLFKDLNLEQCKSEICPLKIKLNEGIVLLTMYVDDCFVIGDKLAFKKTMEEIGKSFEVKRSNNVEDFIGCKLRRDGSSIYLSQPNLIEKLCMLFNDNIKNIKEFETPTGPGVKVMQPKNEETRLTKGEQEEYRSGVGSLLYLLKHSRPDISNCVRELSKVMDGANLAHQKMLHRAIKFVDHTKNRE